MRLLFFALTKRQYRYFKKLSINLKFKSKIIFFPSLKLDLNGLKVIKDIDIKSILDIKFKEIEIKYSNKIHRALYKILLQIQIPWVIIVIYRELNRFKPDYLILWNGKKFHQALALEVAKYLNVKSIFFENGILPDTTTMDFKGVNASNSMVRDIEFYRELDYKDIKLPKNLEIRVSNRKREIFNTPIPKRYIFIPFQVAYDTQIIQHSPWIRDMFQFFDLIEWLANRIDISFVIKEHPSDRVSNYNKLYNRAGKNIIFSSENTQKLIENSLAVITINSSVAVESLLFKKRVIVLGEAFFAIDGLVKVATSKDEILEILNDLDSWQVDNRVVDNFLYYLYYEYLIPTNWREPNSKHYKAIRDRILN